MAMARVSSLATLLLAFSATSSAFTPNKPGSFATYPDNAPFSQSFTDGYSVLKHYGGNGPYSNRQSYGVGRDPPEGCAVDQVIMLKRHGERYPDPSVGANFMKSLNKIYRSNRTSTSWQADLEFLNRWTFFIPDLGYMALESYQGPYAGLLDGYIAGSEYRARYGHLWDGNSTVPIFSSGYERIIQTARKFGEGFLGWNYSTVAALNIISENATQGANSLTPTCVHDNDAATCSKLTNFQPAFDVAAARLNSQNPGLSLNSTDVYNLLQMAAFELNVRGSSPWVDVFTLDEWVSFGYTQDLQYYYCSGPGDKNMKAVGAVFANASLVLLNQGPEKAGTMFWNFCHDTNITPVLATLGVSSPAEDLPLDHIPFPNIYSTGDIVPMGGHLTIERLNCNATKATSAGIYVRILLNEAVVPYNGCQSGPGFSCSLGNYTAMLNATLPSFITSCGIPASYPQYLDFWWNWNHTTALNFEPQPYIPYQQGFTTV